MPLPGSTILFDAVGTLIRPRDSVIDIYHRAGAEYGSTVSREQIAVRFGRLRNEYFGGQPELDRSATVQLESSEPLERELWFSLVAQVFDDINVGRGLFDHLWDYFARAENWQVYPDVRGCWQVLKEQGWRIGIASNFDARLRAIASRLDPLSTAQYLFHSSAVGFRGEL